MVLPASRSPEVQTSALMKSFRRKAFLQAGLTLENLLPETLRSCRKYNELRKKYPARGNWIRFGYLKAFIDGTIGSGTALMFEPFADNPKSSGLAMMPYEEFEKMVLAADKMGFQIGVHSIGDKGNNWTLNAYEKALNVNGKRDSRHRDEHAQTLQT